MAAEREVSKVKLLENYYRTKDALKMKSYPELNSVKYVLFKRTYTLCCIDLEMSLKEDIYHFLIFWSTCMGKGRERKKKTSIMVFRESQLTCTNDSAQFCYGGLNHSH